MKIFPLFLFLTKITEALAHDDHAHGSSWNWDPEIIITLLVLATAYLHGIRKSNKGLWQILSFFLSICFLIIALVSPIDLWSDELQAWHMIQHMLIMMVAAPFFVLSSPMDVLMWSLPSKAKKSLTPLLKWLYGHKTGWYFFWQPFLLWTLFAFTLWVWHLPRFYEAALLIPWLHDIQHISFFITACLFWRVLLDPINRFRMGRVLGIFYLFATTLHATMLGVYMTLSPRVWYEFYKDKTVFWSLTALEDQQLAGLIMWMPACTIYVLVTAFIFIQWSRENDLSASAQKTFIQP